MATVACPGVALCTEVTRRLVVRLQRCKRRAAWRDGVRCRAVPCGVVQHCTAVRLP